jgi:tRNA A-37 threonylcarbamoyl transferase component Bud32
MSDPQLIGPLPPTTPVDHEALPGRQRALPPDLLREASHRLGIMALLGATLWVIATAADHLALRAMTHGTAGWARPDVDDAVALVLVVISLALYWYTKRKDRKPRLMVDLGLGYMVVTAVGIGLLFHLGQIPSDTRVVPEITWIGVVVLAFAPLLPSNPGKMLVAAFLAVSMNPLGMLLARARGTWDFGPTSNVLLMHYPDYLLAGVAVVVSSVVMRLRQQVVKAREMGSYQLNELLGRGGMGEVYRATHRMLARPAAIKLIRADSLGRDDAMSQLAIKRFRREAEAAANLRSPHTVELYDFGVTEDGTFYFVMEFLVGMDLDSLVRQYGPVRPSRAIHILRQACESLEEAHTVGLVHRDIKPANIHVGRLGLSHDFVKVLDFGLVKAVAAESTGHSLETAAGLTPGTPAYMAPEVAMGEAVDGRADIYALGCVGYYLLTGRQVFEAETALQMVARHLQSEPVPPSARSELEVPPVLDRVVLACLAKQPKDRPQSATSLAEMLAAVEVEPWTQAQAKEWWQTHRPG